MKVPYITLLRCKNVIRNAPQSSIRDSVIEQLDARIEVIEKNYAADTSIPDILVENILLILKENNLTLFSTKTNEDCFK